jgi:hypothetical protein
MPVGLRIVRDRTEAEEILQETFVRVWTRAEIFDVRLDGPLPRIVRVADGAWVETSLPGVRTKILVIDRPRDRVTGANVDRR